jgi:hypothetical protein
VKLDRHTLCFLAILLLGAALYVPGLTRGDSDFVLAERAQQGIEHDFYHFHPDERTLVRGALDLRTALDPPLTGYGMARRDDQRLCPVAANCQRDTTAALDFGRCAHCAIPTLLDRR